MTFVSDPELWKVFFSLKTVGDLRQFRSTLDNLVPEQAALAYYISTWPVYQNANDADTFLPGSSLSPDRSAVMYGSAPVIFEGSNHWAWKPYVPVDTVRSRLRALENLLTGIRRSNESAKMVLVIVPEKDHVISSFFLKEKRFAHLEEAVEQFKRSMTTLDVRMVFDQPFLGIERFQSLEELAPPDSHLAGRNYANIFAFVLSILEVWHSELESLIKLKQVPFFGDLSFKFETVRRVPDFTYQPDSEIGQPILISGNETFASPLGETRQLFHNKTAVIKQSVCLLGDSHSSIYSQRKLNYLFASFFEDTYFEWNPCGIRNRPGYLPYQNLVLETSSRFIL